MGYRGEDLDLRTQQTWVPAASNAGGDLQNEQDVAKAQRLSSREGPIWVDETVLACANYAFDVAMAHRAGEVRIEHFLHAMTRIDAAAEALEMRGVRVAALRRESATIIASEIPVGLGNGKAAPRRSDDLAEVLRSAASAAFRRNSPAGIEDVLNVLFDPRTEVAGLGLLARHTVRAGVRETFEQFPPLSRYPGDIRFVSAPAERYVRMPVTETVRYVTEAPRSYRQEVIHQDAPPPRDPGGTSIDAVQNSRIEALEQLVRGLSEDLAKERQVVSGMLSDLSRDTQAQREDQGRMQSGLFDRMQTLERTVIEHRGNGNTASDGLLDQLLNMEVSLEQRIKEFGQGWGVLSKRLDELEMSLRQAHVETSAIDQLQRISARLDAIEATIGQQREPQNNDAVVARLQSIEGEIGRALAVGSDSVGRVETLVSGYERQRETFIGPVLERVNTTYEAQQASLRTATEHVVERLAGVERAVTAEVETAAAKHKAYAQDLGEVHDALMKLNQNQHTLAGSLDQWRTEASSDVANLANRLAALDRDASQPVEMLHKLSAHMDNMNRFIIERYHRRHRFLYWLFGTDDWIGASWPSQALVAKAEEEKLKTEEVA